MPIQRTLLQLSSRSRLSSSIPTPFKLCALHSPLTSTRSQNIRLAKGRQYIGIPSKFTRRRPAIRLTQRSPFDYNSPSSSQPAVMVDAKGTIILDEVEETLKRLLLDVAKFIEENPLPAEAETSHVLLPQELRDAPLELRFAGGWVRDKLLGTKSHDIDVAINKMTGEQFGDRLQQYLDAPGNADKYGLGGVKKKAGSLTKIEKNPEASKNLETVTTKILGIDLDLVNLRKETYTDDSRNPQVEFGTPEEDALRRDATINALFYNITTDKLEDFTGRGLTDMESKIICTPLDPYITFKDDPLRVLRLIRFASRLGYVVEDETKKFMGNEDIRKFFLTKITKERVWVEFEKMLRGPDPCMALSLFNELDLYRTIFIDPKRPDLYEADTQNWPEAYKTLNALLKSDNEQEKSFMSTMITNKEENFLAWFLVSMVPWADAPEPEVLPSGKTPLLLANQMAIAAFKPPNQVLNVLAPSITNLNEIRGIVDRKEKARDVLGMAIRKWGSSWRSQVVFAMLYEIYTDPGKKSDIVREYSVFISTITSLDILEAHNFKPLIDGTALAKALCAKPGPWMKPALDIIMAWQLRNPDVTDPAVAIEEVRASDIVNSAPTTKAEANGHVAKKQKKGELTSALLSHFLHETLKPLFSTKASNPDLTTTGRKRIGKRVTGEHDDLDFGETKPWKAAGNPWALELLLWCCKSVNAKTLETEWGFIIPPLLAVLDDSDTAMRAKGCRMLSVLLGNCPPALLKRTGLAPLFEESLYASVSYLPTMTPEAESVVLLDVALPALVDLSSIMFPPTGDDGHDPARQQHLDTIFRKGILAPYSHAGEHVHIAKVLLSNLPRILAAMGIDSVKHLKDLVPLLSNILADPLGLGYPPLLLQCATVTQSLIANAWPRISRWRAEILRAVCVCWIRIEEEERDMEKEVLEEIKAELMAVVEMMREVTEANEDGRSWTANIQKLVDADARLRSLFDSRN